ncbi:MAG: hypothetical protein LUE11_04775 [Clostridia bacterium]|nr:hypothetical protein [Clostridia bacterium]
MGRNLKSQIQEDNKKVFLNCNDFAEPAVIKYYRHGNAAPPDELHIDILIDSDGDMDKTWNSEKAYQISSNVKTIKEENISIFTAQADFQPIPKRGRRIEINGKNYEISSVSTNTGILQINMHRLKG